MHVHTHEEFDPLQNLCGLNVSRTDQCNPGRPTHLIDCQAVFHMSKPDTHGYNKTGMWKVSLTQDIGSQAFFAVLMAPLPMQACRALITFSFVCG